MWTERIWPTALPSVQRAGLAQGSALMNTEQGLRAVYAERVWPGTLFSVYTRIAAYLHKHLRGLCFIVFKSFFSLFVIKSVLNVVHSQGVVSVCPAPDTCLTPTTGQDVTIISPGEVNGAAALISSDTASA